MTTHSLRLRATVALGVVAATALACTRQKGAQDASSTDAAPKRPATASSAPPWVGPYTDEQKALLDAPVDAPIEVKAQHVYPDLARFTFIAEGPVRVPDDLLGYAQLVTRTLDESPLTFVFRTGPETIANVHALWGPQAADAPDPWKAVETLGGQPTLVDAAPSVEIQAKVQLAMAAPQGELVGLLQEAAEMPGAPPGVYAMLADAAIGAGDYGTAEQSAMRALRVDPRYPPAHRALAEVFLKRGEIDAARQALARALAAYPRYDRAWRVAEVLARGPIHRPVDVPPPFIEVTRDGAILVVSCDRPLCQGYAACKAAFRYDAALRATVLEEPQDTPYHLSATEEVVCLEAGLGAHLSAHEHEPSPPPDPIAELLLRLAQEHGLSSYAMFEILGQHRPEWARIAPEPSYQATVQYVLTHVLGNQPPQPAPGTPGGPPVTAAGSAPASILPSGG